MTPSSSGDTQPDTVQRTVNDSSTFAGLDPSLSLWTLEVLRELPRADEAMNVLDTLANDVGITHVMKLHRWKVPVLKEMYPSGNVGVDPVCVLGI